MERVNFIDHKEKKILHLDFSNSKNPQEIADAIAHAKAVAAQNPPKSLLCLTDVSESLWTKDLVESIKNLAKCNAPYVKASAVLGITGMKKYLLNAVLQFSGRKIVAFDQKQEAQDWLVSQN